MFWQLLKQTAGTNASWLHRVWWRGLVVSIVAHASAIGVASTFFVAGVGSSHSTEVVDAGWAPPAIAQQVESIGTVVEIPDTGTSLDPGGRTATAPQPLDVVGPVAARAPRLSTSVAQSSPIASWAEDVPGAKDIARVVGPMTSGSGSGNGTGDGVGDGYGKGAGKFFEKRAEGTRFVFVVDCSQSMNHPDASEYKTRFNRLKIEMAKSITKMEASSEYFIIFFNDEVHPMPMQTMQGAQAKSRAKVFEWLATVPAVGKTDPRPALKLAMGMRPDVVYFLTDGEFHPSIVRDLDKVTQRGVAIHTFALGNADAETTLKAIAERNGGQYTFIP